MLNEFCRNCWRLLPKKRERCARQGRVGEKMVSAGSYTIETAVIEVGVWRNLRERAFQVALHYAAT